MSTTMINTRHTAYQEVTKILSDIGTIRLTESELETLSYGAEDALLARDELTIQDAASITKALDLISELGAPGARCSDMVGTPAFPATLDRLAAAIRSCAPEGSLEDIS